MTSRLRAGGLAPILPLFRSDATGYGMIRDYATLTNQNLKSLVLTAPGERFDVEYGVGLRHYLFEMVEPSVFQSFKTELLRQQAIYIPYIKITNVEFRSQLSNPNLPENYLGISITYFNTITRSTSVLDLPGGVPTNSVF
jgi:phage baseplate assembly protein W